MIGFDFGTLSFLIALNKVLVSRTTIFGDNVLGLQQAAERAREVVSSFYNNGELPRWPVSPQRMLLASALSNTQIIFAIGHELGHVMLGHFNLPRNRRTQPKRQQELEYEADLRGAETALGGFARARDSLFGAGDLRLAQAGPDIFFTYQIFAQRVRGVISDPKTSTYPADSARRDRLRKRYTQDLPEEARNLAAQAERLFDDFAQLLGLNMGPEASQDTLASEESSRKNRGSD